MQDTYSTKQIADLIGIHVNTVRFYEQVGFLTKPERDKNGYRIFTQLQLEQCRLIRLAMRAEVIQNGLRKKTVEIVRLCAAHDFEASLDCAKQYRQMIDHEIESAKNAVAFVENELNDSSRRDMPSMKRKDAASWLGVTPETLRTWERSGLIDIKRSKNGYRVYNCDDLQRLNIIHTLRCANYSLSSILRLLSETELRKTGNVEKILNTPDENDDIVSVCDRLILSLESTASDAENIIVLLQNMKCKFTPLQ